MGDGSSNLGKPGKPGKPGKQEKPYLEKGIEDLSFMDQITHLGKSFTKDEKKQFFDELSDGKSKKYKIGLLRSRELDNVITIFTESFDFSKKLKKSIAGTNSFDDRKCTEDTITFTPIDKLKGDEQILSTVGSKIEDTFDYYNKEPLANKSATVTTNPVTTNPAATNTEGDGVEEAPIDERKKQNKIAEELNAFEKELQTGGADDKDAFELNDKPLIELDTPPQDSEILTSSDFERKYLGWMNNPELDMSDTDKQKRRNILKSLFRFIFGKKTINEATATTYQKKYRIAYTKLTNEEKLPCKESGLNDLWSDFKKSLEYRRALAMCEMFAARDLISEKPMYVQLKKELVLGLRDMINVLDQNSYVCMQYGYDPTQHELEGNLTEEEYSRILKVFKQFIQQRKNSKPHYTHEELKEELGKKDGEKEESIILYNQLLELLIWTTGTGKAGKIEENLRGEIEELKRLSKEKNIDISELEHLVLLLSTLITMSEKIFTLKYAIQKLEYDVNMIKEKRKRAIELLSGELQKEIASYNEIISKLRETSKIQSEDIKELEDIVLQLSNFIISIEKIYNIQKHILNIQEYLIKTNDYKRKLEAIRRKIENKENSANKVAAIAIIDRSLATITNIERELRDNEVINNASKNIGLLNLIKDPPIGDREIHNQKGGSNKTIYDTLLALLLLKAKNEKSIDIPKFMKKMDSIINALGGRSENLSASFNDIIDKCMIQDIREDGYFFSSVGTETPEFSTKLEELYSQEFTADEKEVFTDMFPCIVYHSKVPDEFQEILGTQPYFLNGCFDTKEDVRLYGLEYEDVVLTPEERDKVTKGGVPLGALVILFLSSKQESSDSS